MGSFGQTSLKQKISYKCTFKGRITSRALSAAALARKNVQKTHLRGTTEVHGLLAPDVCFSTLKLAHIFKRSCPFFNVLYFFLLVNKL
jgi:hypothetical protein